MHCVDARDVPTERSTCLLLVAASCHASEVSEHGVFADRRPQSEPPLTAAAASATSIDSPSVFRLHSRQTE